MFPFRRSNFFQLLNFASRKCMILLMLLGVFGGDITVLIVIMYFFILISRKGYVFSLNLQIKGIQM